MDSTKAEVQKYEEQISALVWLLYLGGCVPLGMVTARNVRDRRVGRVKRCDHRRHGPCGPERNSGLVKPYVRGGQ
jgi:hypothetical protein